LKGLVLKPHTLALFPQLAGLNVGFEGAKTQKRICWLVGVHGITVGPMLPQTSQTRGGFLSSYCFHYA